MPPIVAVLGMHRAGTSLTAAMMQALGLRLSENLMPATEDNAMGYFEDADIVRIHDAVLEALDGRTWRTSSSMVLFPEKWTALPQIAPLKEQLKSIAREQLAASTLGWAFKDPRTAQLLPLWHEIARDLETEIRSVIVLRHPREVSESLRVRDAMNPVRGEMLWVEHYLDALLYTQAASRAYIRYDAWFDEPVSAAVKLAEKLGLPMPEETRLNGLLASLVSPGLRHHRSADDEPCYLPFTRDLYLSLMRGDEQMLQTLLPLLHLRRVYSANVVACAFEINSNVVRDQKERIEHLEQELSALRSGSA